MLVRVRREVRSDRYSRAMMQVTVPKNLGLGSPIVRKAKSTARSKAPNPATDDSLQLSEKQILLKLGEQTVRLSEGDKPIRLGRKSNCPIQFDTTSVSRQHAQVKVHKGRLCVRDLDSRHGTWVDGKKLKPGQWYALGAKNELKLAGVSLEWNEVSKDMDPTPGFIFTSETGRDYQLPTKWKPGLGLGREEGNHVRLHDTKVSRKHAELRPMANGVMVRDLGSSHGTKINGKPLEAKRWLMVGVGDSLQVGNQELTLVQGAAQASTLLGGPVGSVLAVYGEIRQDR